MGIKISKIKVKPGRRATVPAHIEELSKSIAEIGLLNPLTVEQDYTLIAGLHRLEAVKLLGWKEVECTVTSLEGLQAELAELDENIIRCDFSSMESNELLLRRKEIYESLHPETQHGKRNGQTSKNEESSFLEAKPFTQDTAEKLGVSRRTVEKKIKIARDLIPEAKKIVTEHSIGSESALKLARLPAEQQAAAAAMLAEGKIKSVEEYHSDQPCKPVKLPDVHTAMAQDNANSSESQMPGEAAGMQSMGAEEISPPAQEEAAGLPFSLGQKRFSSVKEAVADLKDPNKDCSCTPDSFLAEITEFVKKFYQEIEWFHIPYYEGVFSELSEIQLDYFCQEMDSIHTAVSQLCDKVQKGRVQIGKTK